MKEFEMRNVGSHIEVYTAGGVFLFSADTVREAILHPKAHILQMEMAPED